MKSAESALGFQQVLQHFSAFRRELFRINGDLRKNIYQRIYSTLQNKKFIQHQYLLFFQNTIPALKITSFIPDHISGFMQYFFNLIQCGNRIFHCSKLMKAVE